VLLQIRAQSAYLVVEVDRVVAVPATCASHGSKLTHLAPTLAPRPVIAKIHNALTWSGWRDSNPRPPAPKAGALTKLRYIPCV
jgi:hypothetical protein